jgi:hypothetical protein
VGGFVDRRRTAYRNPCTLSDLAVMAGVVPGSVVPGGALGAGAAPVGAVGGAAVPAGDPAAARIATLKAEKARLLAERKRVQVDLRLQEKKRQRRMKAARNLSNEDLVSVLGARAAAAHVVVAAAKGDGKGVGGGVGGGSGGAGSGGAKGDGKGGGGAVCADGHGEKGGGKGGNEHPKGAGKGDGTS